MNIFIVTHNADSQPAAHRKCTGFVTSCTSVSNPLYVVSIIYDYKGLPSMNNTFTRASFFSCLFHFIAHFIRGLAGAYMNPGRFSLFVHSLVYPITHSSLDGFQPNLVQHFPHVCSTCHTVFSLKNNSGCVCERLLHCRLIFPIT